MSNMSVFRDQAPIPPELWEINCRHAIPLIEVSNLIMAAENWLLERMPKGQKLVIIMGEEHGTKEHKMLQRVVLNAHLHQKKRHVGRNFAFGYERPHTEPMSLSDETHPALTLCERYDISVSFNDAADFDVKRRMSLRLDIDQSDDFTRTIVAEHFPHLLGKNITRYALPCASSSHYEEGTAISNIAMTKNAISHIERTGADIYIQQCGQAHALGWTEDGSKYANSLAAKFEQSGFCVLPVLTDFQDLKDQFPSEAKDMIEKSVKIRNLPNYLY